jgi:hypothetical protein
VKRFAATLLLILATPLWAGRSFNGTSNVIAASAVSTPLDFIGAETTSFWWYVTSTSSTQVAVAKWNGTSGSRFYVGLGIGGGTNSQLGWQYGCCGAFGPSYGFCATSLPAVNHWYHITAIANPTGGVSSLAWSGDGTTCGPGAGTSWGTPDQALGTGNFTIGNVGGGTNFYASGIIAEVADWNVVLSANFTAALSTICPVGASAKRMGMPKPVGYFPLWGASGSSIEPDLSGNALNGTLTGPPAAANHAPCTP